MSVPVDVAWAGLSAAEKRERLLQTASACFEADGLAVSMPSIAHAAGASVGSLYRQFADKDELIAAIAYRRLDEVGRGLAELGPGPDAWADFEQMMWSVIDGAHGCDDVLTEAIAMSSGRDDIAAARAALHASIHRIMRRAHEDGSLRADATLDDARTIWAAVRDADRRTPGSGRRIAALAIDGLRRRADAG